MVSVRDINWLSTIILTSVQITSFYALVFVPLQMKTAVWSILYYFFTGFGITAGYHRLWSHRSFDANFSFRLLAMFAGSGAVQGSVLWWSRHHRAHHRWTDTDRDPYGAHKGLLHSHIMWMILREDPKKRGKVNLDDLRSEELLRFQHKNYIYMLSLFGFVVPTLVSGLGWDDWLGGFFWAGCARLLFVQHATFCVNSLAHYLGEATYDDRFTPRDHFITALVTLGEGYHNFHHEFPSDFRNAIGFWQYDPTKWLIWLCSLLGFTYNLRVFPRNEIEKGRVAMIEKRVARMKSQLDYGRDISTLPTYTAQEITRIAVEKGEMLIIIEGIAYDVSNFIENHPGGQSYLRTSLGKDATTAFNGSVHNHHNAARNLLHSMRYARVVGDVHPDNLMSEE